MVLLLYRGGGEGGLDDGIWVFVISNMYFLYFVYKLLRI